MKEQVDILKKEIVESPENTDIYRDLGYTYHKNAFYVTALKAYEIALKVDSKNSEVLCKMGLTYHNLGDHINAIEKYRDAIAADKNNMEAKYYLGFIYNQESEYSKSRIYLEELITRKNMGHAIFQYGLAMERLGEEKKAIEKTGKYIMENEEEPEFDAIVSYGYLVNGMRRVHRNRPETHIDYLVNKVMRCLEVQELHCFGDSHRSLFSGRKNIVCHNIGSGTAYNLGNKKSKTNAREKIERILDGMSPNKSGIILVFGEIDCMEHIAKNTLRTNLTSEKIVLEVCQRYLNYVSELQKRNYKIIIVGINVCGYAKNSHGSMEERARITKMMNETIERSVRDEENIYFSDITHITEDELGITDLQITKDGRHLDYFPEGSEIMQALLMGEIIKKYKEKKARSKSKIMINENKKEDVWICILSRMNDKGEKEKYLVEKAKENFFSIEIKKDRNDSYVKLFLDTLDHNEIDFIEIKGSGIENNVITSEYYSITEQGVKSQRFEVKYKTNMIEIYPEKSITRIVGIKLEIRENANWPESKMLNIENMNVIRKKIC